MREKLVLFTSLFPYTHLESFLESEIKVLCTRFKSIEIIPCNDLSTIDLSHRRELPENAQVRIDLQKRINQQNTFRWKRIFSTLMNFKAFKILINEMGAISSSSNKLKALRLAVSRLSISVIIYRIVLDEYSSEFDNIVFYSYWLYDAALALGLINQERKIACCSRAHRADLFIERKAISYLPFHYQKISSLCKTILISDDGFAYLLKKYGDKIGNKLVVSKLGVLENPIPDYIKDLKLRLISCSYLRPLKRVILLAKSLALCEFPLSWTHIGDGEEMNEIQEICKTYPINIEYKLLGSIPNSLVLDFYRNNVVDFFINVSEHEGLPMAIMEAQSFGIPVIATDVGGNRELVNSSNGFLLPLDIDEVYISSFLHEIHKMSLSQLLEKRKHAYLTWAENSNAEKQYSDLVEIFQSL